MVVFELWLTISRGGVAQVCNEKSNKGLDQASKERECEACHVNQGPGKAGNVVRLVASRCGPPRVATVMARALVVWFRRGIRKYRRRAVVGRMEPVLQAAQRETRPSK